MILIDSGERFSEITDGSTGLRSGDGFDANQCMLVSRMMVVIGVAHVTNLLISDLFLLSSGYRDRARSL